jgi:hypothetical protein
MPTRKQRRRQAKGKRHEYEYVYVDEEGNELDDVPDELADEPKRRESPRNGAKPAAKSRKQPQQRGGRAVRVPPQPSWQRAVRRSLILGAVVLVLFATTSKGHYANAIPLAVIYTALFIPFTYYIDRFAYRRWQARQDAGGSATRPAKKR